MFSVFMMDDIVVNSLLEQANSSVQVAMSMVCKQWASVARAYSMRYKTLSQATKADCSIAISRIFSSDDPEEILKYRHLMLKYVKKGQSRHFARFIGRKLDTLIPFCYVRKYGVGYVDWLVENNYFRKGIPVKTARAVALGCKRTINNLRCTNLWAAILYANGHDGLCWPLRQHERDSVFEVAGLLSRDSIIKVLSAGSHWNFPSKVAAVLSAQEIQLFYGNTYHEVRTTALYITDDREKAETIRKIFKWAGVYVIGSSSSIRADVDRFKILRKLGDFSIFDGCEISEISGVRILPEHVEFVRGKLAPGLKLERVVMMTYRIR
jgi:hypothetical protein